MNAKTMKRIISLLLSVPMLLLVLFFTGCTSYRQLQLEQTMLLQENQRLEDALYITHAQLVDSTRENEALKNNLSNSQSNSIAPAKSYKGITQQDATDDAPLFPSTTIEIPPDSKEKSSIPDLLKKTQIPRRSLPKSNTGMPELLPPNAGVSIIDSTTFDADGDTVNVGDATPVWKPTRQD